MNTIKINILLITLFFITNLAPFQQSDNWTALYYSKGFHISFIYYREANNINNGIVVRLINKNDFPIIYSLDLIFRSEKEDIRQNISGILLAGEIKTGSDNDLFFIPFKDKRQITEMGISNCKIERKD